MKKKPKSIREIERRNTVNLFTKTAPVVRVVRIEMWALPHVYLELQLREDLE